MMKRLTAMVLALMLALSVSTAFAWVCPNCGADMQSTMDQVKHGHWVKYSSPLFAEWECSECGERHTGNDLPDECPHCKAKMGGGENDTK